MPAPVSTSPPSTLFFDVGGVILTNGWDRVCRRLVADQVGLDWEEFADRHEMVAHDFETGRIDLDGYLQRTVFYRSRSFSQAEFVAAMFEASSEIPGTMQLLDRLKPTGVQLITLNNESLELNEYRIQKFELKRYFDVFLSSCYLGVKKPEPDIYRIALQVTQVAPEDSLFIDDRPLNLECGAHEGMTGLLFTSADQLELDLVERGLL